MAEINKVVYGDETLIDLTEDSVTPDTLLDGETAHDKSGNRIVGRAISGVGKEDSANKTSDIGSVNPAEVDVKYPSVKAVKDYVTGELSDIEKRIGIHSTDITNLLKAGGTIRLAEGEYTISSPVVLPASTTILGSGFNTIIRSTLPVASSAANQNVLITMSNNCTIKDCNIIGTGNATPVAGFSHCIQVKGICSHIESITIQRFTGYGIWAYDSTNPSGANRCFSVIVRDCYIASCHYGILLESEFNCVEACVVRACVYGLTVNAGNNLISNSHFDKNTACLRAVATTVSGTMNNNHGHSSIVGCTFNHGGALDSENTGWGFFINGVTIGLIIANCQWFYAKCEVKASKGIMFHGCEFGSGAVNSHDNVGLVMFKDNIIQNTITFTASDTHTKYEGNYNFDGSVWKAS